MKRTFIYILAAQSLLFLILLALFFVQRAEVSELRRVAEEARMEAAHAELASMDARVEAERQRRVAEEAQAFAEHQLRECEERKQSK